MSGVYKRNRTESELQWVMTARRIRIEVDRLAHSEKVIPKSWRLTHAARICDEAASLVHNVRAAYNRYPSTALAVRERRHYLQLAIDDCTYLVEDLQELKDVGLPINLNRFDTIAGLLSDEIALLKNRRSGTRLTGKASPQERIARLEMELSDLRDMEDGQ